jgi:hypothetical protein
MKDEVCVDCGGPALRVLSYGLPARLCADERCCACWGPGAWVLQWLPFTGVFRTYPAGGYWRALWAWMMGRL